MKKRPSAPLDLIPAALEKTGFILEHHVATEFKKAGWSTISGRYYADDVDGRARELDLVAYRSKKVGDVEVVHAILVSCKKDEEHTWVFLTKERPKLDPNFDWDPVHYWTDVEPLKCFLASHTPWKADYLRSIKELYETNLAAAQDTFAFQQVSASDITSPDKKQKQQQKKDKASPKNDSAIFNSIVSLMKALDHEMESLSARAKGRKRVYMFSLLSVVDASMVEVSYADDPPVAKEIERLSHLARYMVRRRDSAALIHFVRADVLPNFIGSMTNVADASATHMNGVVAASYEAIRSNSTVRDHFAKLLLPRLGWRVDQAIRSSGLSSQAVASLILIFKDGVLQLCIDVFEEGVIEFLNSNVELRAATAKILKDVARYEGEFTYDWDIPF